MSPWVQGALFVVCGVPGVFLVLVCSVISILAIVEPSEVSATYLVGAVTGLPLGTFAALVGVGKWNQWRYGLVILALPATFVTAMSLLFLLAGISVSKESVLPGAVVSLVAT